MRKADNLPPSCAVVMKSGNLNFLELSRPLQAFNGTDLPFYCLGVLNGDGRHFVVFSGWYSRTHSVQKSSGKS